MTRRDGYTLVEVLVSILIFALISAAGVALLRVSVANREAVRDSSAAGAALLRVHRLLKSDIGQAADRPVRASGDAEAPALAGHSGPVLLSLTRAGDGTSQPWRRVEYRLEAGRLERRTREGLDTGEMGPPQILMEDVVAAEIRFISRGREAAAWSSADGTGLPDAVEVRLDTSRFGSVPMVFLVGGVR